MPIQKYIEDIQKEFKTGVAREHTYRPALKTLLEKIIPDINAMNEPAQIDCGAPDYILKRRQIDVGYIEAKDIGVSLDKTEKSEQLKRYMESLENLILTDYLEFRFYLRKEKVEVVRVGEIINGVVKPIPENFDRLTTLLIDFASFQGQTIKSAKKLASMMAQKAKLMKHVFLEVLQSEQESTLKDQLTAFQEILVQDMDAEQFADVYAQTIAYGLFTARLHDETQKDFTRSEALLLIPKSNPFLRQLFTYVAGAELDKRVVWIVDALCEVFLFSDKDAILKDFGNLTGNNHPILHFYETFLSEYDASLRKARGVWYTPESVVNFIVRAIDDVLKTHFNLPKGLADNSKIKISVDDQHFDKRTKTGLAKKEIEVHKVQLLDVATGTGTFIGEAINQIYSKYKGQEGIWSSYVENDLLPRLHGFELLMASYAMCHLKLDMMLQSTGYKPSNPNNPPRVSVYLTNSLEEEHKDSYLPFANWLSREANEASRIKRDMPIMVAFGNPPYSGISSNMSSWIAKNKIEDYKYVDGVHFNERKHWLNDDYVQFIRMGEHYVEKNGEGVLAYITNRYYVENPTFRGMRLHLLNTFDDIYIYDLHGQSGLNCPDGEKDENVFDIQKGVAIIIAVKHKTHETKKKKPLATVHHADLWGKRDDKYKALEEGSLKSIKWCEISPRSPFYFLIPQTYHNFEEYHDGFAINNLFVENNTGVQTGSEVRLTSFSLDELIIKLVSEHVVNIEQIPIKKYAHKAFDNRWMVYLETLKDGESYNLNLPGSYRSRNSTSKHMFLGNNIALISGKSNKSQNIDHFFVTDHFSEVKCGESTTGSIFCPLYRYESLMDGVEQKVPNFDPKIYATIKKSIPDVTPESLFDYIYAVLHAPKYRERYAEFLKSDFPRIPYPQDMKIFHALVTQGAKLRALHLMESPDLDIPITTYPVDGDHEVVKPRYEDGNVYINETQYFGNVPLVAWEFYIGGYQPAQKWLKDRKGRNLSVDDIMHYQRIIIALRDTAIIMTEIDKIDFLPKGE